DGQGLSGGPTSARISRRSVANASSGVGPVASSSRKRSALIRRSLGDVITATGAPARVISNSSPAATRFRSSEKRRAASVAESRVTLRDYQINLIKPDSEGSDLPG